MLRLSDDAAEAIRELAGDGVLRLVGHKSDEGVEIETIVADEAEAGDEVVEHGGARVALDAATAEVLDDQLLDVHAHGDHVHFVFSPQDD
jgi:Fe-S cluster assembly iron-binding protein IscA